MIKRFLMKLLLLAVPLTLLYGFPAWVLWVTGEFASLTEVIETQSCDSEALYGPAYSNAAAQYKLRTTQERDPKILALGTSRVMQFRAEFFSDSAAFYNAGGAIQNIFQCRSFLAEIPKSARLRVILLGFDQWEANPNYVARNSASVMNTATPHPLAIMQKASFDVYKTCLQGRLSAADLLNASSERDRIGLHARLNGSGFRADGSRCYGAYRFESQSFPETMRRIEQGTERFEYGQELSQPHLDELALFLDECASRNIHVVVFLPPFAHAVYQRMSSMNDQYKYLEQLPIYLKSHIAETDHSFFNFSDIAEVGATDDETLDGFHGSEDAYLRLTLQMAQADAQLRQNVSLAQLQDMLSTRSHTRVAKGGTANLTDVE